MPIDTRQPCSPAGDREIALDRLLRAANRLALLSDDWYPNEYHFISEETFAVLLELRAAAGRLSSGR
jgi:hypothetical protein